MDVRVATARVGDAHLHVRECGTGPVVVVVHGGPEFDHEYLLPELDVLADSCRLVYYDQRGRGRSWHGESGADVDMATDVADLDGIRRWSGSPTVTLLGHSWGTLPALEYALQHPQHVHHLVLMNTAPVTLAGWEAMVADRRSRRSPEEAAMLEELQADPAFSRGDLDADLAYLRLAFAGAFTTPEQLESALPRFRRSFTPEGVVVSRAIDARLYEDTWADPSWGMLPRLRTLDVPTLLVHGENDFIPRFVAEEMVATLPRAHLELVPGGHFSYLEHPDLVHDAVTRFLTGGP